MIWPTSPNANDFFRSASSNPLTTYIADAARGLGWCCSFGFTSPCILTALIGPMELQDLIKKMVLFLDQKVEFLLKTRLIVWVTYLFVCWLVHRCVFFWDVGTPSTTRRWQGGCTQLEVLLSSGGEAWPLTLVRDGSNFLPLLVKITTSESSLLLH